MKRSTVSRSSTRITGDAAQVVAVLAWAKKSGLELNRVSVGGCTVDVRQPVTPVAAPERTQPKDPRIAIYEQFGGEAYRRMTGQTPDTGVRGEEYEPALGNEQ